MNTTTPRMLLVAMLFALGATACGEREADTMGATPADDPAATAPPAEPMAEPLPPATNPVDDVDPCAGLMDTELEECRARQADTPPSMIDPQQTPPADPEDPTATPPPPG